MVDANPKLEINPQPILNYIKKKGSTLIKKSNHYILNLHT